MMKLRIDGTELILADDRVELPSFDVKRLRSCEGQREGDAIMLSVRTTSAARELFGFADQAYPAEQFNNSYHYGEVVVDGVVLYSGVVSYLSTTRRGDDVIYNKICSFG